jgi:hypothetical protein
MSEPTTRKYPNRLAISTLEGEFAETSFTQSPLSHTRKEVIEARVLKLSGISLL